MNRLNQPELTVTQTLSYEMGTTKSRMRKVILFIVIVLSFGIDAVAQKDTVVVIGQKMDGTALSVPALHFDKSVFTFSISDDNNHVCISYRNLINKGKQWSFDGELSYIKLKERQELWRKPIDYRTARAISTDKGVLTYGDSNIFYSDSGGVELWRNTSSLCGMDNSLNLIYGYTNSSPNNLCAYSLTDGSKLWSAKINGEYGWSDVISISPSQKLIIADNLYQLNLSTGALSQYPLHIIKPDTRGSFLEGLAMAASGFGVVMGKTPFNSIPIMNNRNVIGGMVSNIYKKDSLYYIADCDKVSCIDTLFHQKWTSELPEGLASYSKLFIKGDVLYMVNFGYGLTHNSHQVKSGKPFFAAFDIHTGDQIYLNVLSSKKKMVKGFFRTDDAFYILLENEIVYMNFADTTYSTLHWNIKKYGKLNQLITGDIFVIDSIKGIFTSIAFDGVNFPVYSSNRHVYVIDKKLKIKAVYPRDLIYLPNITMKDYAFVSKDQDLWLIDKLGLPVIHFNVLLRYSELYGNKLVLMTDNNDLVYIDLDKAVN